MSNPVVSLWNGLGRGARSAALGGTTLVLALAIWVSVSSFAPDYRVLFADLSQTDAAAIVARLKDDKIAYRLSADGSAILVPAEQVHDVRLALMAGDLPLSGGVGFEIFDKQGLGATEHSQKVSYQRALQGELARTIGKLDNVKEVRVHLVMPESTLFTRDRQEASAAVALTMQPNTSLERQQIAGVQRLVAAAVPGLSADRVVITDQRGVTLSAADSAGVSTGAADARLQVKREIEDYITHKIAKLLDSAFGPGQAIVSVDAVLNFDATKTTIQDLLPAGAAASGFEGRVVRRRQVNGASTAEPMWSTAAGTAAPARTPGSSMEVEYEYGRRIDEVIAAPGAVTRVSVGVIVPDKVTQEQRVQVAELVKMAAGIDASRGDAITIQALSQMESPGDAAGATTHGTVALERAAQVATPARATPSSALLIGVLVALIVVALALTIVGRRMRRTRPLTDAERQRLLEDIQRVLADESNLARGRAQ
jgi:flagellar M-ring protein FliF